MRSHTHRPARFGRILAALAAGALLLTACGAGGELVVDDVRARAQLESVGRSAVYLDITNDTDTDAELVAARVPAEVAGSTEIHETVPVEDDGTGMGGNGETDRDRDMEGAMAGETAMEGMDGMGGMEMREVGSIPIPAGETVSLEPGGLHIMLFELAGDLTEGQTFDVELEFADGTTTTVEATVTTTP